MKLSRLPGFEPTVKLSFSFKKSTHEQLQAYHQLYQREEDIEVPLKDVVEQMLLEFMADDKAFQRELKRLLASKPVSDNPDVAPTAGHGDVKPAADDGNI